MTDNNEAPEYSKPINDVPSKEDIDEKPFYDTGSAPIVQNLYNPPQNYNPDPNGMQPVNQASAVPAPNYAPPINYGNTRYNPNYDTGVQYYVPQSPVPRRSGWLHNPKILIFNAIILILVFIADLIVEITFNFFSPFILADCVASVIIAIILIVLVCNGKPVRNCGLGTAVAFVWFVGFGLRGFGMTQFKKSTMVMIDFFLLVPRTLALFFSIPQTVGQGC